METATLRREHESVLLTLLDDLVNMRFGAITLTVHEGRITRIDRSIKIVRNVPPNGTPNTAL